MIAGVKNSAGTIVFVCSKGQDLSRPCPMELRVRTSWYTCWCARSAVEHLESGVSIEAREKELREFAKRVELLT